LEFVEANSKFLFQRLRGLWSPAVSRAHRWERNRGEVCILTDIFHRPFRLGEEDFA